MRYVHKRLAHMDADTLRITEVSLSFHVLGRPRTPVDSAAPFVADTREGNKERVLPARTEAGAVPNWVANCKQGCLRFTYESELQSVECTFKEYAGETNRRPVSSTEQAACSASAQDLGPPSKGILTLHGIKQRNFGEFFSEDDGHLNKILRILGAERRYDNPVQDLVPEGLGRDACCLVIGEPHKRYKATLVLAVGAPWDRNLIADVITNDPEMSQVAAMSETVSTLGNRSLFSVSVVTPGGEQARVTLRHDELESGKAQVGRGASGPCAMKITATISRLSNAEDSVQVAEIVGSIFRTYSSSNPCGKYYAPELLCRGLSRLSGISLLRSELPELFVNNYTRECPVLPIMVSREQAELLEDAQRVIFYPLNSTMGRFYTAPRGYFVGLKRNRLANRDMFPCLVTCYLHDHMLRMGSETHNYYTGGEAASRSRPARPVPRSMGYSLLAAGGGLGYDRRRAPSFVRALEAATGETIDAVSLPWCPQVVKQEMWDSSDEDIMGAIQSGECGPPVYRYFEELLAVSIHVIVIRNGMFDSMVPLHYKGPHASGEYIWAPPYPRHVIIFETIKKTYGETRSLYDILAKNGRMVFCSSEPAVLSVVTQKKAESICPPDTTDAVEQLIDERGKCRMVVTSRAERLMTLTRPLTVPVVPDPVCFFDLHTDKMNALRRTMGLRTTDSYKRSTNSLLYFPNDVSFNRWIDRITCKP